MVSHPMRYSLSRPAGWVACLPSVNLADAASIETFVDPLELAGPARRRFEADLARLADSASRNSTQNRLRWLYVRDAADGSIVATMTVDLVKDYSATPKDLAESLTAASARPGTDIWNRAYEVKKLAGLRAVTGQELIQVSPDDGQTGQLNERYLAILFTPVAGVLLELSITTYDLAAFSDIVAYGDSVVDSIAFLDDEAAA